MATYSLAALRRKQFFRSPQWEVKLVLRILLGFFVVYMLISFLLLGLGLHFILKDSFPEQDPFEVVNAFLIYYFGVELIVRIYFQKLPVTDIQSFLLLPIKKTKIIRSVMRRLLFSGFNAVSVLIFLPFSLVQIFEGGPQQQRLLWWLTILMLSLCLNYLAFFINKSQNALWISAALLGVYFLERFKIFDVANFFGILVQSNEHQWISLLGAAILLFGLSLLTYRFFKRELYLDRGLQRKKEQIIGKDLSFLDRLGKRNTLLKNDIRLIFRNARSRQVLLFSFLFLFYGLIFFPQEIYADSVMLVFAAIFTTGGFTLAFGQYVPAWDSEYYPLLMCQNLTYRSYLESKWRLMAFSVIVSLLLCLPYLFFGVHIYLLIVAGALFNLGIGTYVNLISGALNRSPIKLNVKAKAFENTQAFSLTQFLFIIPKLLLPMGIYWIGTLISGFSMGIGLLAFSGLLGLCFHQRFMQWIEQRYLHGKHRTLEAFLNK